MAVLQAFVLDLFQVEYSALANRQFVEPVVVRRLYLTQPGVVPAGGPPIRGYAITAQVSQALTCQDHSVILTRAMEFVTD